MTEEKVLQLTYTLSIFLVGLINLLTPKFSAPDSFMGVRFSQENLDRVEIKGEISKFYRNVIIWTLILSGLIYAFVEIFPRAYSWQAILLIIFSFMIFIPIIMANKNLKTLKSQWNDPGPKKKVLASTDISGKKFGYIGNGLWTYLIGLIATVISMAFILANYDKLPDSIPTHFDFKGQADAFTDKSLITALFMTFINLFLLGLMFFSSLIYLSAKQRLDPGDLNGSVERYLYARKLWTYSVGLSSSLMVLFLNLSYIMLLYNWEELGRLAIGLMFLGTIPLILVYIILGIKVGSAGEKLSGARSYSYDGDDDKWIFGGMIYYNPDDPAVLVYKRVGVGTTVNLGTKLGKFFVFAFVFLPILLTILVLVKMG